jgi:hypothetical protein
MFGERPPVYNFSGTLVNYANVNWVTDFMFMYERYLRGTRCVERDATAVITYGGRQIEGLILNTANQTNASLEGAVQFQFSIVVFERKFFNFTADMGLSTEDGGNLVVDEAFASLLRQVAGVEGEGMSNTDISAAHEGITGVMEGQPAVGFAGVDDQGIQIS